ncbi:hypothetical protein R6Q57_012626 [Mikania cordata]
MCLNEIFPKCIVCALSHPRQSPESEITLQLSAVFKTKLIFAYLPNHQGKNGEFGDDIGDLHGEQLDTAKTKLQKLNLSK